MSNARKLADNLPREGSLSGRNVLINGAMNIAQRATSASGVGTNAGAYHTLDRWKVYTNNTAGRLTMSQSSDAPSGFVNSLKFDCTTATSSAAADTALILITRFEGQDLQRFGKGTSAAKEFTISFYVKGDANATYGCELVDHDNSRQITKQFSVTTTWTRVVITFPADTTGAFDDDNNLSVSLNFWLHAGSNHNGGTLNSTSWAANVTANRVSSSQTSFFDSTNREFYLTGVQLEVGNKATPFEHEPVGVTLNKCLRYYFESKTSSSLPYDYATQYISTHRFYKHWYNVPMRATPTVTTTSEGGAPSHYEPNEYHWKGYVAAAASASSARLTSFVADAEF